MQKAKYKDSQGVAAVSNVSIYTDNTIGDIILPTFTASLTGTAGSTVNVKELYGSLATFLREEEANALIAIVLHAYVSLCIKGFNSNKCFKTKHIQFNLCIGGENVQVCAYCVSSFDMVLNIDGLADVVNMFQDKGWDLVHKQLSGSVISHIRLLLGGDNGHILPT